MSDNQSQNPVQPTSAKKTVTPATAAVAQTPLQPSDLLPRTPLMFLLSSDDRLLKVWIDLQRNRNTPLTWCWKTDRVEPVAYLKTIRQLAGLKAKEQLDVLLWWDSGVDSSQPYGKVVTDATTGDKTPPDPSKAGDWASDRYQYERLHQYWCITREYTMLNHAYLDFEVAYPVSKDPIDESFAAMPSTANPFAMYANWCRKLRIEKNIGLLNFVTGGSCSLYCNRAVVPGFNPTTGRRTGHTEVSYGYNLGLPQTGRVTGIMTIPVHGLNFFGGRVIDMLECLQMENHQAEEVTHWIGAVRDEAGGDRWASPDEIDHELWGRLYRAMGITPYLYVYPYAHVKKYNDETWHDPYFPATEDKWYEQVIQGMTAFARGFSTHP